MQTTDENGNKNIKENLFELKQKICLYLLVNLYIFLCRNSIIGIVIDAFTTEEYLFGIFTIITVLIIFFRLIYLIWFLIYIRNE